MSKHSKWAKIKNQKTAADQKKGAVFTKHVRAVTVAARQGADPATNFQLRVAIDSAKAAGVPKDTIERALSRVADKSAAAMEEALYEGFGPGGVALLIEAVTDNKNRTSSEIRHLLEKFNGSLGSSGSVAWQFQRLGVIRLVVSKNDELELKLIDLGVEDTKEEEGGLTIYTRLENFKKLLDGLPGLGLSPEYSGLEWVAKEAVVVSNVEARAKLDALCQALEENDDVLEYYTNEA